MAEQLTALDATFLELEEADEAVHMHIGAAMLQHGIKAALAELRALATAGVAA